VKEAEKPKNLRNQNYASRPLPIRAAFGGPNRQRTRKTGGEQAVLAIQPDPPTETSSVGSINGNSLG
jgi:hypothetical protein